MSAETTYTPAIMAVGVFPNPAYVGECVRISVSVIDVAVVPAEAVYLSGEFQSGEA